ncbi:TolC family outer membrane protein [Yoonia sp. I 8.24]|uniref:TolC family outer membrane protein n=1 Tax=Yoonia sp. I 8.24 TaxID=1537229 RepID=UPI001EDDBAAB|nr:TolC family outer membrane protein [Yoonia sp. I 8.24]MCG3266879.1 TolC family outer membrane protein [Yoonia sp. I 8.24]
MKKRNRFAALAVVASIVFGSVASAETLSAALTAAYNNSGLLEQNRALLRAADEDVAQAVAATMPVIAWSLSASSTASGSLTGSDRIITNSGLAAISGSLTLYDGGLNRLSIDAQKELVLSTRQTLRGIGQDVLLRAVQAYMDVRRNQEFVQLRESNVRVITQEYRAAQDRFDVGEVTRTDVASAEARLAAARSLLAAAQGALVQSMEEYNAAIGHMPGSAPAVSAAPVSQTVTQAKEFAVRNHPSVLEVQHSVAAAELNIRRGEVAVMPTVDLEGSIYTDEEGTNGGTIELSIGGPIYYGGQIASVMRQLIANRDAARAGLYVTTAAVEQQVGNSYASLQIAQASRLSSDQQISAARVAFEGVREEATLGSRTTLEVLNAEQELLDAQASRISSQADEVIASYAVLAAMGLLTAEHLQLPVQQYDPTEYYNLVKDSPALLSEQGRSLDRVLRAIGEE